MTAARQAKARKGATGIYPYGDDRWRIQVSLGRDENGGQHQHKEVFAGSLTEAKVRRAELLLALGKHRPADDARCTLGELLVAWVKDRTAKGKMAASYRKDVDSQLRTYILADPISDMLVVDISPRVVDAFYDR